MSSTSRVEVVTVTISSTPSSTDTTSFQSTVSSNSNFPYASVIGGSLGGIFLAIIVVVGWKLWGRSIKRKEDKLRTEALSNFTTRENTRRNASMAVPIDSYSPAFPLPQGRKVKFASLPMPSDTQQAIQSSAFTSNIVPASPLPMKSRSPSPPPPQSRSPVAAALSTLQLPQLTHKVSNASSLSMYSTQSGESHQTIPPVPILARKFDPRRLSSFARTSRTLSQYSTLGDIEEQPQHSDKEGEHSV